jgi:hypothetical protein
MAKSGAILGGAISGLIASVSAINDYCEGTKNGEEAIKHVAKETAGGAISGAAAGTAATMAGSVLSTLVVVETATIATTALTVGAPVVVALAVGFGVKCLWDSIFD